MKEHTRGDSDSDQTICLLHVAAPRGDGVTLGASFAPGFAATPFGTVQLLEVANAPSAQGSCREFSCNVQRARATASR